MFTKLTKRWLRIACKVFCLSGSLPFQWDEKNRCITKQTSRWRQLWFWVNLAWLVANAVNHAMSLKEAVELVDIPRIAIDWLFAFGLACFALFYLNLWIYRREIEQFVPALLNFDRNQTIKTFGEKYPLRNDGCALFVVIFTLIPILNVWPFVGLFPVQSESHRYFYHFLPSALKNGWTLILFTLLEYMKLLNAVSSGVFQFILLVLFSNMTTFWLKSSMPSSKFTPSQKQELKNGDLLGIGEVTDMKIVQIQILVRKEEDEEKAKDALKLYAALQLLTTFNNQFMSKIYWPIFLFQMVGLQSFGLYGSLMLSSSFGGFLFLIFPTLVFSPALAEVVLSSMIGGMNYYSLEFLRRWRSELGREGRRGRGISERGFRSKTNLGAKIGQFNTFRKTTILSILLLVSNVAINIILLN